MSLKERILLLGLVLIGCSSGVVALVSTPDDVSTPPTRLSFPEPLQSIKGYNVNSTSRVVAKAVVGYNSLPTTLNFTIDFSLYSGLKFLK